MHAPVPWIALAAIAAMFVLPWLDARGLLDGPRTIRHRPRRHVCADCAEPWQPGHACAGWQAAAGREPVVPLPVYEHAGGHAYGSVYPGPIGAVLPPQLTRADQPGRLALPQRERRP
jgi:hypothetical protein